MTTTTAPPVLRIPDDLADDARHLVADLAAVAGTEADVLAALYARVSALGTRDALREFVAALVCVFAECLPGPVTVTLPHPTKEKKK